MEAVPLGLSPHGSDEEVEDPDGGDADEDVQGPLDHRAVRPEAVQHPAAAVGRVPPAGVGRRRSRHRGAAGGGGGVVLDVRCRHRLLRGGGDEHPTERNQNRRQKTDGSHVRKKNEGGKQWRESLLLGSTSRKLNSVDTRKVETRKFASNCR